MGTSTWVRLLFLIRRPFTVRFKSNHPFWGGAGEQFETYHSDHVHQDPVQILPRYWDQTKPFPFPSPQQKNKDQHLRIRKRNREVGAFPWSGVPLISDYIGLGPKAPLDWAMDCSVLCHRIEIEQRKMAGFGVSPTTATGGRFLDVMLVFVFCSAPDPRLCQVILHGGLDVCFGLLNPWSLWKPLQSLQTNPNHQVESQVGAKPGSSWLVVSYYAGK